MIINIAQALINIGISDELRLQFIKRSLVYLHSVGRIKNKQKLNLQTSVVAQTTGLTLERIEKLKQQYNL